MFDFCDFVGLFGWCEVFVDDIDVILLCYCDCEVIFGDCVYCGGYEWYVQGDVVGQFGFEVGVVWENVGEGGNEEYVIESECFLDQMYGKFYGCKSELYVKCCEFL